MKLPFFDFDDSYPLTLGVADDYFTLSQRLKRLGRAPKSPRKRALYLFGAALLVSFVAVVPFRLTARAQNEAKIAQLSGTVEDASGQAVAGATVYLARRNSAEPLETTDSDRDGHYEFSSEIGENRSALVWADAGARGLGQAYISQSQGGARIANPVVAPLAPVKLLLVAPDGTRAANLRVRVGQMGPEIGEQWILPRPLAQKLQTQTNAHGEAVFAALPVGQIVQFWLSDQKFYSTDLGFGDLRGGQYAPLGADEGVKIGKAQGWKTIRLLAPVTLRGNVASRVSTPVGIGKSGALVTAIRLDDYARQELPVPMTTQARTGAQGDYVMAGLRPGLYRVQVESEPWLARSSVSPVETRELKAPSGRVDLALSSGGLIRGIVRVKGTNAPAAGQNVGVIDAKRNYQVTVTDARGAFEFRANVGNAFVLTPKGGGDSPQLFARFVSDQLSFEGAEMKSYGDTPNGFSVISEMRFSKFTIYVAPKNNRPAKRDFTIGSSQLAQVPVKAGATREITLEIPAKELVKNAILSGQVSRPDGTGARANVMVRPAADIDYKRAVEKPTDARGRYSIAGLKPGRYKISAQLDDATKANWVAPKLTQTLETGANRADIKLAHGAVIEGVVWAKSSHHVIPGVEVLTADPDGDGTIEKTRSNGVFRFRVAPGRVAVRLHQSAPPPPGFKLTRQEFVFDAKNGGAMQANFELTPAAAKVKSAANTRAITGVVMGPDGQPVAGAEVAGPALEFGPKGWNSPVITDAKGRFRLYENSANLFARKGDLTTARGTFATLGDDVTLQLERDVYASVEGQITDRASGQPISGAKVWYSSTRQFDHPRQVKTLLTDEQGRFRFERLRPFQPHYFTVSKNGYGREIVGTFVLQKGRTKTSDVALKPLSQTLRGRVLDGNGKAVGAGYILLAGTTNPRDDSQQTTTRADGSFTFANVPDEKLQISVIPPGKGKYWDGFWTRGGRENVGFGLTDARLHRADAAPTDRDNAQLDALEKGRAALVGAQAPPLRAARWIGAPPSLRGKVTLIYFVWMNGHSSALNDFARGFAARGVQVVSVEQLRPFWNTDAPKDRESYIVARAREMGVVYPVAIDLPLAKRGASAEITGQSHQLYRGARFVIVGRDGVIAWVGNNSGQAIARAAALAK